jgi:predicted nucleotidyltransferase
MRYEKAEILNYLQSNKEYYRTNFNVIKIGIFGSYSRDAQTDNSDKGMFLRIKSFFPLLPLYSIQIPIHMQNTIFVDLRLMR